MDISEQKLAPVRARFGDADGALPVAHLTHLYNDAVGGVLPLFDERLPDEHWKRHVRRHGMRPTGVEIFTATDEWKNEWDSDGRSDSFAVVLAFMDRVPRLFDRHHWLALSHVCEGVQIKWVNMIGVELTPRPEVIAGLTAIVRRWRQSTLCDPSEVAPSYRTKAEEQMAEYRAQLADLGVGRSGGSPSPVEAFYPIDATQEALEKLAADPPALWALSDSLGRGRPIKPLIVLLSQNSD